MIADEILNGENKNIEYKRELPSKSDKYIKSLVAFANTSGGKLVIGIEDENHEVIGVDEAEVFSMIDTITNVISDTVEPQRVPNITCSTVFGKYIIIVEIYPGNHRPYYIKSIGKERGTYIRIAGSTRHVDSIQLKELELQGMNQSYDETVLVGHELDMDAAQKLCVDIKKHIVETTDGNVKIRDVTFQNLENWGIVKRVENILVPTVAFDLLTTNSNRFAKVQCALFKGITRSVFIDKREFEGSLYSQIEESYQFILNHINLGAEIDGIIRKDIYELPVKAIREAIVNAVTHRSYMDNSCVQVCIYDDRVEITSPGMLFGGLTLEMMMSGSSKIKNTGIAEIFSRMHIVEGWGTGVQRMLDGCKEYNIQPPKFTEIGDCFRVKFFRKKTNVQENKKMTKKELVCEIIVERNDISNKKIAEKLNCSPKTVYRYIKELKSDGIIERVGSDKQGYWKINKKI
ncbi:MAG: putative DNA binding domain-containing protein [Clostridiales bacterium]|nr:putative DNA binding domain-containing protein [Clostridiales bacterium]